MQDFVHSAMPVVVMVVVPLLLQLARQPVYTPVHPKIPFVPIVRGIFTV